MANSQRIRVRLRALVVLPLLWLPAGCVYLPWFETVELTGSAADFRSTRLAPDGVRNPV